MSGRNNTLGREEAHEIIFTVGCPIGRDLVRTQELRDLQLRHLAITGNPLSLAEIARYDLKKEQPRLEAYSLIHSER